MAASKNTQQVAGLLTAMAMIVKPQCDEAAILASPALRSIIFVLPGLPLTRTSSLEAVPNHG
jgi:hypothetical protein